MGGQGSGRSKAENHEILLIALQEFRTAVADLNRHLADPDTNSMAWWRRLIKLHDKVCEFKHED